MNIQIKMRLIIITNFHLISSLDMYFLQWASTIQFFPYLFCSVTLFHIHFSSLKKHSAYVLRWNRGKNIYFFSHI